MSFVKRFLSEEGIINNIGNLTNYLGKPDVVFLTDEFSKEVYNMFTNNISEEEIIKYIEEYGTERNG